MKKKAKTLPAKPTREWHRAHPTIITLSITPIASGHRAEDVGTASASVARISGGWLAWRL